MKIANGRVTGAAIKPRAKSPRRKAMHIVFLSGQGDTYVKVVDKDTFDWINGPMGDNGGEGQWIDKSCPPIQLALLAEEAARAKRSGDRFDPDPWITRGSYDNDRAMMCFSTDGYETYYSIVAATRAISKKGHKLAGEYEGCVY